MLRLTLLIAPLCAPLSAVFAAQIPDGADRVPRMQLASPQIRAQIASGKQEPMRFAVPANLEMNTSAGTWDEPEPGVARWRLRVTSSLARSLSFQLQNLELPPAAELWIYGRETGDRQGPFTDADGPTVWTPLVRGTDALIEVRLPAEQRKDFRIGNAQAFHGYKDVASSAARSLEPNQNTGNGKSGACNIDVACPEGDGWRNQIRATVLLTINNTRLCSGTLVNNALQNDRALVLTANHCYITDANVTSLIAYFNSERSACGSGNFGRVDQNIHGKVVLVSTPEAFDADTNTDFALIELASKPPNNFNAYYAGLDPSGNPVLSGVGTHHPVGDDKKISAFDSPAVAVDSFCLGNPNYCEPIYGASIINAWRVNWSRGATEEGSSGSGLWNPAGLLVGTLSGGFARCESASANNGQPDYYARLDTAWTADGEGSVSTLKAALDPNDSGCTTIPGKSPGSAPALSCRPTPPDDGSSSGGGGSFGLALLPLLLVGWSRRVGGSNGVGGYNIAHLACLPAGSEKTTDRRL